MRREGYEFQVSKANVIYKEENGHKTEPIEHLTIDVPEEFMGVVMEKMGPRKAEMVNMTSAINGYTRLEFKVPSRGLIGFRSELMTDTKGNGIMNHVLDGYDKYRGEIPDRSRGSLIVFEDWRISNLRIIQCSRKRNSIHTSRNACICRNGCWRMCKSWRYRSKCM